MLQRVINGISTSQKSLLVFLYDSLIVVFTFFLSFELRLDGIFNDIEILNQIVNKAYIIVPVQLICFQALGLYRGIWRFSSTPDLLRIIKAVSIAIPVSFIVLVMSKQLAGVPRSVFFIQWALLLIGVGGGRFAYRLYRDVVLENSNSPEDRSKRVLILGAGYAAQILIRDIKNDMKSDIRVVGLLDDDYEKRKKILHGVKVLGGIGDVAQIAKKEQAAEVIIAIPSATKSELSRIVSYCDNTNLKVKTIPRISDLISGKVQVSKLRKVTPEDLLGREEVNLDMQSVSHMILDKNVLITGAGGSIGSELCNQVIKLKPNNLICFDMSEYNMYELTQKLAHLDLHTKVEFIVGDVTNQKEVEAVFDKYRPDIVFHAAAYKHVPLMERNPNQAIKANIQGTRIVANLASKYHLDRFVLVSTDKAVNPTNVMGTTKRIAEMICQSIQKSSKTKFIIVRFGNVLGSSGSVIPKFQRQIEEGGPVTVTHAEIQRYFMSIPEASQLVIQAGALGNGGEIFVLDMGESVKIVELARQMITLAGLVAGEDIDIKITGLRPGEKLFEELLADEETTLSTAHDRVRVAKVRIITADFDSKVNKLIDGIMTSDINCIRSSLKSLVPEYDIPEELRENVISIENLKLS